MIHKAIDCIIVSQEANTTSYKKRNYYMVDHATSLLSMITIVKYAILASQAANNALKSAYFSILTQQK